MADSPGVWHWFARWSYGWLEATSESIGTDRQFGMGYGAMLVSACFLFPADPRHSRTGRRQWRMSFVVVRRSAVLLWGWRFRVFFQLHAC